MIAMRIIGIDIPARAIELLVAEEVLADRRARQDAIGWRPAQPRPRKVSTALKAYALLATSADKGAVRDTELLDAAWSARARPGAPAGDVV